MKIGILGCGATGSVFASYLRMGGADDIWLIDLNKAHMDAVRDHGMTMTDHNGVHHLTGFRTAYSAQEVGPCDIFIILVKSTATIAAMSLPATGAQEPFSIRANFRPDRLCFFSSVIKYSMGLKIPPL